MKPSHARVMELKSTHGLITAVGIARREAFLSAVDSAQSVEDFRNVLRSLIERLPDYVFQKQGK